MERKSVLSQLASAGEGALERLAHNPATKTAVQGAIQLKTKGAELVHGLDSVDERLTAIEKRLEKLEQATKPKRTPRPRAAATKSETKAADAKPSV